jgi:protein TIF31
MDMFVGCSDRTIYRVYSDFVDAATKGAVAIIHGSIPPINPMDPKKSFVYIYNNIFFSYAVDVLVPGTDTGDRQSYAQAAADVRGVAAYAGVDLPELYTLATTLVTYRGRRLIAQSIIPGIFHGDRASAHV